MLFVQAVLFHEVTSMEAETSVVHARMARNERIRKSMMAEG